MALAVCPCGNEFEQRTGVGKPYKYCVTCRTSRTESKATSVKPTLTSIEKIDKLEEMLRSRGTHIQQNRNPYD